MDVGERTRLGVQVLGDLAVAGSGARPLGGPTQRRAFAALVVHRNETTTIDQLVDACWPDGDTPKRAEHNVRTYVHRLRGALGEHDGRIETAANGYRIRLEPAETDIDRFEQLAGEAGRLIDVGEPVAALDRLEDAESLWHGRPYAEFADEPWVEAEVARLEELHRTIGERRAEALLAAGRPGDAVGVLERLVRDEPYREGPRALLMRALYESGRPTEALRAFQDFRRFLIDDAGVDPSTDLVELDRRIASGTLDRSTTTRHVGNYELHERIGEGAFAVVHRATQTSLGRDVAVKIVRAELADQPEFIRRFETEAQMVAAIEHPNVVPLFDYWREPGNAYLVMRWMTGGSLEQRLDDGPWTVEATLDLVDQIAAALDAAHARDVVHRDVKPANILFDDAGRALLGDFGIALAADERSTPQAALSEGSPIYASPEQLRREPAGPEADVHALAIVAFTALVGRTPFHDACDDAELLRRRLTEPVPAISTVRPGLPLGLDDVIATATARRPEDRYPTAPHFAAALRAAVETPDARPVLAPRPSVRANPYRGLRPFTEADADVFHGRGRLVGELVDHLRRSDHPLLVLVGPSGSGKSSVVRAGLIPTLRADAIEGSSSWFTTTMIPGAHPFEALETALLRIATNPPPMLLDQLHDGDRGMLRGIRRILPDDDSVLALVVDQLEELFTAATPGDRERFLRSLTTALTEPATPLRVVATLRADFYDQPLRHGTFAPLVKQHTIPITPLAPDELEVAITAPAADVGVDFEPGLIAEIIADVNSQPGALPLLQYALTRSFDTVDGDRITIDAYRDVGGLTGALTGRADALHDEATPAERVALRRLLGRLVQLGEGTEDTRRRVRRSELPADAATHTMIDRFGAARLLTFDHDPATRDPTVEIAHEALLREWPRLREWLDDDRDALRTHRHLTAAANGWAERARDPNELYRGARLDAAEQLLDKNTVTLNEQETAFLRASLDRRDMEQAAERLRVRRLHRLVGAMAVVAAVALIAGTIAFWQWRRADEQTANARDSAADAAANAEAADRNAFEASRNAADAEANARRADANAQQADASAALAGQRAAEAEAAEQQADLERVRAVALATAPERPVVAALLAVEAHRLDPSVESLDTLHRVLTAVPGMKGAVPAKPYYEAELLADQRTMVTSAGTIDLWDIVDRTLLRSIPIPEPDVLPILDVAPDGRTAVVVIGLDAAVVVDLSGGVVRGRFQAATRINDVSLSRDGARVAIAQDDGRVTLWDADGLDRRGTIETGASSVHFARWSPVDDTVTLVTSNSTVQSWETATSEQRWSSTPANGPVNALNSRPTGLIYSSDGTLVVVESGSLAPLLRTYRTTDGTEAYPPTSRTDGAVGTDALMWIDEARRHLAAGTYKGFATYDLTSGEEVGARVAELNMEDAVYSPLLGEVVAVGGDRLQWRSIVGAGPLERVVPLTDEQRAAVVEEGGTVHAAISPDGSRLVVSSLGSATIAPTTSFDLTTEPMAAGSFPYDDHLAFGNGPYTMTFELTPPQFELLDADDRVTATIALQPDATDQDVSADGRMIAIARVGGLVDVYDGSGELLTSLDMELPDADPGRIVIPSLSDDGRFLLASTARSNAVWSTDTYQRLDDGTLLGQSRIVGDQLVNRRDNVVQRYELPSLEPIGPIMINESGGQFYPAIDLVHRQLAVTTQDTVTVYDLDTGEQLGRAVPYRPIRIEFTAASGQLVVPSSDRVTIWNFDTESWPGIACRTAGRNLTRDEWQQFGPRTIGYRATCEQFPIEP